MQYKLANLPQLCFNLIVKLKKGEIFTIHEKMKNEQIMLDKKISSIKEHLKHLPSGKLVCSQNGSYQKWYQSDGHKKTYIPKSNKQLAEKLSNWSNTTYERNQKYPEQLMHKSSSGNYVRSKSESIIDMMLYIHKIPFRYECALTLGETTLFPDFTIRHPKTGDVYYWEHFG